MPMPRTNNPAADLFKDLGFSSEEASDLMERSRLITALSRHLKSTRKTQGKLGEMLGIGQSRVSDLLSQKISLFSLGMLVTLSKKAGLRIEVTVRTKLEMKPPQMAPNRARLLNIGSNTYWNAAASMPRECGEWGSSGVYLIFQNEKARSTSLAPDQKIAEYVGATAAKHASVISLERGQFSLRSNSPRVLSRRTLVEQKEAA